MVEEPLSEEARARQRRAITPRIERKDGVARSTLVNSDRRVHVCLIGY
jgi:hypothetical protein